MTLLSLNKDLIALDIVLAVRRFDWPMTLSEAQSKIIEITIKNDVGVFSKSPQFIGVVRIDLSQCDLTKAFTNWYVTNVTLPCQYV